ncbi:UxaA family hydrolase [Thalassospira alkalitolerans]|uniref:UxaA family hydrolase n=1 Tax=Thalassospira alkalitolerans TaxID=1293890 RepID=UPI003AA898BE
MTTLRLHPNDNIEVVLTLDPAGSGAAKSVPVGHKIAICDIAAGALITKFGQSIGVAGSDIRAGDHVHVHNCIFRDDLSRHREHNNATPLPLPSRRHFKGFKRANGTVGTRNFIAILSTVNCSATVCTAIAKQANLTLADRYPEIDGFVAIVHEQGCGMSGAGTEGYETLKRTLSGYQNHPNFAASLIIGLGCEVNQVSAYHQDNAPETHYMTIQSAGGTRTAIQAGLAICETLATNAAQLQRQTVDVSGLVLGMQCGGSDGFSAISANPALGIASDLLVAAGGTSILSETPEIFGAEHLLLSRMDAANAHALETRLVWWRNYAAMNGASLDNNPSPGNKAGGLTTILEKSLGAVAKGGQAPVAEVIEYAQKPSRAGLIYMDTPGYDPVSATGQIAGGANLIAFTTGRGSCFGSKPAPTVKLSTTTALYNAMTDDMDINCGTVLDGQVSMRELGAEIYETLLNVASGEKSKSELNGLGDLEFAPWRLGAVL